MTRGRSHIQFEPLRDAMVVIACGALLIWAAYVARHSVSPAAKPNPNGAYTITVGGGAGGTGKGKAVVNNKFVKVDATIDDGHGNVATLSAAKLPIDSSTYRFSGTGILNSLPVKISGRFDPPDPNVDPKQRTLKSWRITATYVTTDGKCVGRVVGGQ